MNLADVKIRVKRSFGDESAVQVTDTDILRWVNDGQQEVVKHNPELLEKKVVTNLVTGQQEYTFPADLLQLRSLSCKPNDTASFLHLTGKSMQEFDEYVDGWDGPSYSQASPLIYTTFSGTVLLFPIPDISITGGLKLYYYRKPTDLVNDVDVIDLPLSYHNAIVEYCLRMAYEMDEDWTSVGNKANEFLNEVGLLKTREKQHNQETYTSITVLADDQGYEY